MIQLGDRVTVDGTDGTIVGHRLATEEWVDGPNSGSFPVVHVRRSSGEIRLYTLDAITVVQPGERRQLDW